MGNQSATLYFVRCDSKIDLGVCGFAREGSYLSNATVIALPAILRWIASTARGTGLFALSGGENGVSSTGRGPIGRIGVVWMLTDESSAIISSRLRSMVKDVSGGRRRERGGGRKEG